MIRDFERRLIQLEGKCQTIGHERRSKGEREALCAVALTSPGGLDVALAALDGQPDPMGCRRAAVEAAWRADT